tara:strand:- start:10716 stop:11798 length:1083 start_codon:yes stop_codon:yes gene_type:complete
MNYMSRAISLSKKALGSVSPNPAVGALVVNNDKIVGEGWTQPPGQNHAEIMAIEQAGELAKGASLYTTLEPCNYHGRTPPCVEKIIKSQIKKVHISILDPNKNVYGQGIKKLQEQGIETELGELSEKVTMNLEGYLKFVTKKSPFITAKFAMSLDGKIATKTGDSKWISGDKSRRFVHELRSASDAIIIGVNTVIKDNPKLTARNKSERPISNQPLRIILDTNLRTPLNSIILKQPGTTIIATNSSDDSRFSNFPNVKIWKIPKYNSHISIPDLLATLYNKGISNVLIESGGTLLGTLFDQKLIDKVIAFISPKIIGGENTNSPVIGTGIESINDSIKIHNSKWRKFGDDMAMIGYCNKF